MPKSTVHNGPTNELAGPSDPGYMPDPDSDTDCDAGPAAADSAQASDTPNDAGAGDATGEQGEETDVLWKCVDCGTEYAAGLDNCPHCGSANYAEAGVGEHAGVPDGVGATGDAPGVTGATPPPVNATKADWVNFARNTDKTLPAEDAEAMTKAELIEKYGRKD